MVVIGSIIALGVGRSSFAASDALADGNIWAGY